MAARARKSKKIEYVTNERAVIKKTGIDIGFLATVILLVVLGLIMVFSASYPSANFRYGNGLYFISRQAMWAGLGAVAMFFAAKFDYRQYRKLLVPIMIATFVMLVLVLVSSPIKGARRWLGFGSFSFQPSEFAKISIIIFLAAVLADAKEKVKDIKYLFKFGVIIALALGLLLLEPHYSVCIIICLVIAIMLLVAGFPPKYFIAAALILVPIAIFLAFGADYRADRLAYYIDPFQDKQGKGWQIIQSLYAIGSGGFFGLGFGNSRQKFMYVSEPQNDFIFAIICEELGLIGAFVVIALFGVLIWRGIKIAVNAPDNFGSLLVVGIMSLVGVQTFLNIAVVTKMIPTTGISLPFFSAGGSSLVFLMGAMGMVLNVSSHKRQVISVK
ncbi:MAG: putative lipid II flippase FtsW [Clostridia bacterium]|nr:putative lipid II flippase FtsW [Clostridia bacterium]